MTPNTRRQTKKKHRNNEITESQNMHDTKRSYVYTLRMLHERLHWIRCKCEANSPT